MVVSFCINCQYHLTKLEGEEWTSHCQKENCWVRYSKCVLAKALEKFLKENSFYADHLRASI